MEILSELNIFFDTNMMANTNFKLGWALLEVKHM